MSDSVGMGVTENASGGKMPLRHALAVVGVFLQFCGATLLIELFSRAGNLSACGYRAGVACEKGSALLGLGAPVFIAGILFFGLLDRGAGWAGSAKVFSGLSLLYGTAGIGLVFAWAAATADSVVRSAVAGVLAVIPLWVCVVLARGFFQGLRRHGAKWWAKETFWTLEDLPQSKRARKRILRTRGLDLGRMRNGRLEPETRQEKFHWTLFFVESCAALIGGVLAGWLFIVSVSS
ncbi:hypothetical protein [Streptomyces sp. NBC_00236]|uniref:hypothetical protein n=1 Tax=Streptomyces sp. NBC_00236 TaxID=2903639 RepID=UPI002E2903FE|nr:hypothetical protein [Streptomyces sp. NBC_00236]